MSFFLNVSFQEKDIAKKLGACWEPTRRQWYVLDKYDYPKFQKWFPNDTSLIVCDYLYIIEGVRECYKCGRNTKVIAFGIENFYEFADPNEIGTKFAYNEGVIHILPHLSPFPDKLFDYVSQRYNYHKAYSYTIKASYLANNCEHCDALQGDWFLFQEPDSPFFISAEEDAAKLTLYKIPLIYDIALANPDGIGFNPEDSLIKEHGKIITLDPLILS